MVQAHAPSTMSMFLNYNMATTEDNFNVGSYYELRKDTAVIMH
jgi:hypothetical protein